MDKNYTIGLDIGTNSVGWAVIDDEFKLVKGKKHIDDNGKKKRVRTNMWGVELFDEGETAADRRLKRGSRRRIKRRHERINYLRGIFEEEILKVDESFFITLDESFYQMEDKKGSSFHYRDEEGVLKTQNINDRIISKYPLFINEKEERDYYKKFPTVYHLREFLMESDEKADIRLVYLALHHIIKYRGHFTNQGQTFDLKNTDLSKHLEEMLTLYGKAVNYNFGFEGIDKERANSILKNRKVSKSGKVYELKKLYKVEADTIYLKDNEIYVKEYEKLTDKQKTKYLDERDKQLKALFTAIVGNKIDLEKIFGNSEYKSTDDNDFPKEIYYKNEDFEDIISKIETIMDDDEVQVILQGKKVYESIVLSGILSKDTLSASMVDKFETHKKQLKELKEFTKNNSRELYVEFFGEAGVYTKFVDGVGNPAKKTNRDEFYKEIRKTFEECFAGLEFPKEDKPFDWSKCSATKEDQDFLEKIFMEMNSDNYLPKQRMSDNGAIPYQVHEAELLRIIEKQGKYYPFLLEKSGNDYKIQKLMKFRIPYYVGPLTEATYGNPGKKKSEKSSFAWMQKKEDRKVTPWNFDAVVDKDASSVEFIERMTSFCTYLPNEKVLAKNTLLYQEFCVYNELVVAGYYDKGKKYRFGADRKLLTDIVTDLFKNGTKGKITQESVIDYLEIEKGIYARELFGIDKFSVNGKPKFNNILSSYHDLRSIGIEPSVIDSNQENFDDIITWQTIFTDKGSLKKRIESANKVWNILDSAQIEKLSNKHYTGFGSLSRKLIDGIRDKNTNLTIIETLRNGGYNNFMRLISGETAEKYSFKEQIEKEQTKTQTRDLSYELVDQLAGSPAIKKGIWQSLKILKELEKYLGRENISKVVIEMSKGPDGGRTKSRYKELVDRYKNFENANKDVFDKLKSFEKNEKALNNEKIHLYFRQNGIDAYTNEPLDLDYLSSYEVDHIIPQSFLKDDSIDNKVLVSKVSNQQKGGDVPSIEIVNKMKNVWEGWVKAGLISQKKLKHLTTLHLNDNIKEGFINRQLVENRQITKHVANILSKYFDGTDTVVLTPKSGLTSQFRKGILYFPNPEFNEVEARKNPKEYGKKKYLEKRLHNGFPKFRDLNDYHHAHDAYLNAIVALYIYRQNPALRNSWVYGEYQRKIEESLGKWVKERKNKSLQLLSDMKEATWEQTDPDTGEVFEFDRDEVIAFIEKTLDYHNVNVVKKTERQIGKFGDESTYKKDLDATNFVAGKKETLDPNKYGGTKAPISAFFAVVEDEKENIMPKSIPSMLADKYMKAVDKLAFIRSIYPNDKITEIKIIEVDTYTKFIRNNNGIKVERLVASYQEAQKANSLTLTLNQLRGLEKCDENIMNEIFDKITEYLIVNAVYNSKNIDKWKTNVHDDFKNLGLEEKQKFINDSFSIVRLGTTNAKGMIKGLIGAASGQQQHKNSNLDIVKNDTVLIYQSVTGLYETRRSI